MGDKKSWEYTGDQEKTIGNITEHWCDAHKDVYMESN